MSDMNFHQAVATGKKVRSVNWEKGHTLDTSIFSDEVSGVLLELICQTSVPLSWRDILGRWELVE